MSATQETRTEGQEQEILRSRHPLDFVKCPCFGITHYVSEFNKQPLRVYDYAILQHPRKRKKYIIIAFVFKDESHWAIMAYNKERHRLLKSFEEKFKQELDVLLTPRWETFFVERRHGAIWEMRQRMILECEPSVRVESQS